MRGSSLTAHGNQIDVYRAQARSPEIAKQGENSMSIKTFAAIDVGSFELTMKMFEFSGKNSMREIDCISRRLDLGSDTYAHGKISNEKMDELCRTLKEY